MGRTHYTALSGLGELENGRSAPFNLKLLKMLTNLKLKLFFKSTRLRRSKQKGDLGSVHRSVAFHLLLLF